MAQRPLSRARWRLSASQFVGLIICCWPEVHPMTPHAARRPATKKIKDVVRAALHGAAALLIADEQANSSDARGPLTPPITVYRTAGRYVPFVTTRRRTRRRTSQRRQRGGPQPYFIPGSPASGEKGKRESPAGAAAWRLACCSAFPASPGSNLFFQTINRAASVLLVDPFCAAPTDRQRKKKQQQQQKAPEASSSSRAGERKKQEHQHQQQNYEHEKKKKKKKRQIRSQLPRY
ncbi:hypothetical protein DFH27DRAFT_297005 [Peziza echinospora]|nr:hypothetical protein DFH27DRAFT_297005 [Peziza echinospora]